MKEKRRREMLKDDIEDAGLGLQGKQCFRNSEKLGSEKQSINKTTAENELLTSFIE